MTVTTIEKLTQAIEANATSEALEHAKKLEAERAGLKYQNDRLTEDLQEMRKWMSSDADKLRDWNDRNKPYLMA